MAEVFVLGGGKPTPTEFRPGGPKTVNHPTQKSPQSRSKVPGSAKGQTKGAFPHQGELHMAYNSAS